MSTSFAQLGNDLHAGKRLFPIVARRRLWYLIALVVIVLLSGIAAMRGANLGIEFTGGSEFQISGVSSTEQSTAREVVRKHVPENEPKIAVLGADTLRVQTEQLDSEQTVTIGQELAKAYGVSEDNVSSSFIGPVWGQDITEKMLRGIVVFLLLVAVVMALYFRNLKASIAAMLALVHDMLITGAVYGVVGFEITPATVIGFLTILGYSLYDTIVVFDKVRENTEGMERRSDRTFAELVELAANQTLVRSINTSVVALLPVGSILAIGAFLLGAGTLKDISLALFVGIIAGTYSSIFLAPGLLVDLRRREQAVKALEKRVEDRRAGKNLDEADGVRVTVGSADDGFGGDTDADDELASEHAVTPHDEGADGDPARDTMESTPTRASGRPTHRRGDTPS